jgi:hypothetical protein
MRFTFAAAAFIVVGDVVVETLFKYVKADYLREILDHGRIRIGTLYEYRNTAEHQCEIADGKEGRRSIVVEAQGEAESHEQAESDGVALAAAISNRHDVDVRVLGAGNGKIVVEAHSPDLYLFSASLKCDRGLMLKLGYDACLRIDDSPQFFAALSQQMCDRGRFLGYREVIYEDPACPKRAAGIHPAFFKRADFAHQAEVRALWESYEAGLEPLVITCRDAAGLCTLCMEK